MRKWKIWSSWWSSIGDEMYISLWLIVYKIAHKGEFRVDDCYLVALCWMHFLIYFLLTLVPFYVLSYWSGRWLQWSHQLSWFAKIVSHCLHITSLASRKPLHTDIVWLVLKVCSQTQKVSLQVLFLVWHGSAWLWSGMGIISSSGDDRTPIPRTKYYPF